MAGADGNGEGFDSSSSARVRRAACSPTGSRPTRRHACCCSRPAAADTQSLDPPAARLPELFEPEVNWGYQTEPEPGLNGRRDPLAAGQGAGRLVVDQRPGLHPRPARGLRPLAPARHAGWSHDDVLPYFKRAEDQQRGATSTHGAAGPLAVSDVHDRTSSATPTSGPRRHSASRATTTSTAAARRGRLLSADQLPGPALLGGGRLPAARAAPAEPRDPDPGAGPSGSSSTAGGRAGSATGTTAP